MPAVHVVLTLLLCSFIVGSIGVSVGAGRTMCVASFIFIAALVCKKSYTLLYCFMIAMVFLGYVRGGGVVEGRQRLQKYSDHVVTVTGMVRADPGVAKNAQQTLSIKDPLINGVQEKGDILILVPGSLTVQRGDRIRLEGSVLDSSGRSPLVVNTDDIVIMPGDNRAVVIRNWFADAVKRRIPEPGASLGLGFLVGQKSSLPPQLMESIQTLGLSHIIVASGYNLTVIIRFIRPKLFKVSRFNALCGSLMAVWLFSLVTGFSPSMLRASLVATLSLLAWYFGLRMNAMTAIVTTAFMTLLYNPAYIYGDIGWYLSYLSFFGVLVIAPQLEVFYFRHSSAGFIAKLVMETVSALIMTLPLTMSLFGGVSPLVLVANLIIVPLIPLAMMLTGIAGMSGILPNSFSIIAKPAELLIGLIVKIIEYMSSLPFVHIDLHISNYVMYALYGAVLCALVFVAYRNKKRIHESFIEAY